MPGVLGRRAFLVLLAAAAAGATGGGARAAAPVTVLYVGGWDCPPCLAWKRKSKPDWLAAAEFGRVRYVEIESPRLKDAYQDQYWPAELIAVRDRLPKKTGTPRFIVLKGEAIVANEFGGASWQRAFAAVRKALG